MTDEKEKGAAWYLWAGRYRPDSGFHMALKEGMERFVLSEGESPPAFRDRGKEMAFDEWYAAHGASLDKPTCQVAWDAAWEAHKELADEALDLELRDASYRHDE